MQSIGALQKKWLLQHHTGRDCKYMPSGAACFWIWRSDNQHVALLYHNNPVFYVELVVLLWALDSPPRLIHETGK